MKRATREVNGRGVDVPAKPDVATPVGGSTSERPRAQHPLLGATILSGAVAGAIAGIAGGPPGIVAGIVLGTATGFIAGSTLDAEASRSGAHDHELDRTIGVDGGDLGAREAASRGLTDMDRDAAEQRLREREEQQALEASLGADEGVLS